MPDNSPALAFERVTKTYGSTIAVDAVSLTIAGGNFVALVGTSLGVVGAILPLVVGAAPFYARLVEGARRSAGGRRARHRGDLDAADHPASRCDSKRAVALTAGSDARG